MAGTLAISAPWNRLRRRSSDTGIETDRPVRACPMRARQIPALLQFALPKAERTRCTPSSCPSQSCNGHIPGVPRGAVDRDRHLCSDQHRRNRPPRRDLAPAGRGVWDDPNASKARPSVPGPGALARRRGHYLMPAASEPRWTGKRAQGADRRELLPSWFAHSLNFALPAGAQKRQNSRIYRGSSERAREDSNL